MMKSGFGGVQVEHLGLVCGFLDKKPSEVEGVDAELVSLAAECEDAFCRGRSRGRFLRQFAVAGHFMTKAQVDCQVAQSRAILGI